MHTTTSHPRSRQRPRPTGVRPVGRATGHPALEHLGDRAPGWVRNARARRRRYLTRQVATGVLLSGVCVSAVTFTFTDTAVVRPAAANDAVSARPIRTFAVRPRPSASRAAVVGSSRPVAARRGAYADLAGQRWVPYPAPHLHPFLVCTRGFESDTAGGYRAVSRHGTFRGAYQFRRSTWNVVARHVHRFDLVGVDPAAAAPTDQDWMALYLYEWLGASHWEGRCAGL